MKIKLITTGILFAIPLCAAHAADTTTQWQQWIAYLTPPPEYDRPYKGELIEIRADRERMDALCPKGPLGWSTNGCALGDRTRCVIVIATDDLLPWWRPYREVRRHEIAHCNGWPANHPRSVTPVPIPIPTKPLHVPITPLLKSSSLDTGDH
jgi:hypothetical protein